jgi:hypothetical protein
VATQTDGVNFAAEENRFPTMYLLCSNTSMTDSIPPEAQQTATTPVAPLHATTTRPKTILAGTIFDFTPVPMERMRAGGWSDEVQRRFIKALSVMGSVGAACRAVGMGRVSAYRLRARVGAASFAAAWDRATDAGRMRQYDYAMERALYGITTVRVLRGGSVVVGSGPDMQLVNAALRDIPVPPGAPIQVR